MLLLHTIVYNREICIFRHGDQHHCIHIVITDIINLATQHFDDKHVTVHSANIHLL